MLCNLHDVIKALYLELEWSLKCKLRDWVKYCSRKRRGEVEVIMGLVMESR